MRGGAVNSVTTRVHVIQTNMGGFRVNSPGNWTQGARRLITWQNVGTNNPPFNVANVRISLSTRWRDDLSHRSGGQHA